MSYHELTIINKDRAKAASPDRYALDKDAYNQGRGDAVEELNRDSAVYYTHKRDKDLYNMGYSYGEIL